MKTVSSFIRTLVLLSFCSITSTAFAESPDFAICEDLTGVAKGLCRAGVAVGCDQESSIACENIEAQYTAKTGNEPPWMDRAIYVRSENTQYCPDPSNCGVPLDGAWTYGCEDSDDPDEPYDAEELLIFLGETVEAREILYASQDGTCDGVMETESLTASVAAFGDFQKLGWIGDFGFPGAPPERSDGLGPLTAQPFVTHIEFRYIEDGVEVVERTFVYIDDTAEPWIFYREDGGDDDVWGDYLDTHEPRFKL